MVLVTEVPAMALKSPISRVGGGYGLEGATAFVGIDIAIVKPVRY